MDRAEHLQWAKERALSELSRGTTNAWASMVSDLQKHPDTATHPTILFGAALMVSGRLSGPEALRKFILDFN